VAAAVALEAMDKEHLLVVEEMVVLVVQVQSQVLL
jgi:hypothetical protein|tara:strand:+ start:165 stop:269 length:105 start_codon:yes stop_codon:yes gene_type:complete